MKNYALKLYHFGIMVLFLSVFGHISIAQVQNENEVMDILKGYAVDYEKDVMLKEDVTFAVKVDEQFWHVIAKAPKGENKALVTVYEGKPSEPTFYFFTDIETLRKINKGELNALTGSAKAFSSDFAPFDADVMEGFQPTESFMNTLLSVLFHFWTKGDPEIIPYGLDYTRMTHGAQASILYYQPGFRSGYVAIKKGQHANEDKNSKTNPFPSMLIIIKGEGKAIINGNNINVKAGETILIPPGISHEFMNPDNEEPLEAILLMFGEGA